MAEEDKLTLLYSLSVEMANAGEDVKEKHEDDYKKIIEYVKNSDTKERLLAAQLIARFFKYFPAHEELAFDSIVDLCESANVDVRKHAIMTMIAICKDCKHLVSKAADILIQLYQTQQPSEVNLINQSLTTLLNLDIQKFLKSFFTNFEDGTEVVRERALKFLASKIHTVAESSLTKEVEEQLLTYSKKAMEDVTKDEFITFVSILSKLKIAKTAIGQAMIFTVIKSQAELDKDFNVNDTVALDKLLLCIKHAIPLLSQYIRGSEYINYICLKILPHFTTLASNGNDLKILQALAEMSSYIHEDDIPNVIDIEKCQQEIFNKLLEFLPLPHTRDDSATAAAATEGNKDEPSAAGETKTEPTTVGAGDEAKVEPTSAMKTEAAATDIKDADLEPDATTGSSDAEPKADEGAPNDQAEETKEESETKPSTKSQEVDFQFTHIEHLLYTFHQFGRFKPEFVVESLTGDFKLRLGHLASGCHKYMELLSAQLRNVKGEDLKKEENKLRSVALRTTKNISLIVRDFFKKPPQFKTSIVLSCKPLTGRQIETAPKPQTSNVAGISNNNNNNTNKRMDFNKGQYNNGGNHNKSNYNNRQTGQKHKYRQSYQNDRNKRPRYAR